MSTETAEEEQIKSGLVGSTKDREDAFDKAYNRYAEPLAAFIRESVAPSLDSDEVATAVSEAFCGLARYIDRGKFKADGAVSTLLFSMARLKAYDLLRSKTSLKRRRNIEDSDETTQYCEGEMNDEEIAIRITERLVKAPEIRELWRTAVETCVANEIIRQFRLWVSRLPRLQRKVAQSILKHFGDVSDQEIRDEISTPDERPTVASVKSARKQISEKFKSFMQTQERNK